MSQKILEQALEEQINGNPHKALSLYEEAIKLGCEDPAAFANLGSLYSHFGDKKTALFLTLKAIEIEPNHPIFLMNLGGIYKDLGEHLKALDATKKSLQLDPINPAALTNYGSISREIGNLNEALGATQKSLEIRPDNSAALFNLGAIYQDLGRTEEAASSLQRAIEANNTDPEPFLCLAEVLLDIGDLKGSLQATKESMRIYRELLDETKEQSTNSLRYSCHMEYINIKKSNCLINLASIYAKKSNLKAAICTAKKATQISPANAKAYYVLGTIQQVQGNIDDSIKSFNESLTIDSSFALSIWQLSRTIKDNESAEKLLTLALNLAASKSQRPGIIIALNFAMSNCYHHLGDFKNSGNHLLKANELKLDKYPSDINFHIQAMLKEHSQAIASPKPLQRNSPRSSKKSGENHIFIVGAPRSGSTLLETVLSTNKKIHVLGETNAMELAITQCSGAANNNQFDQDLESFYRNNLPRNCSKYLRTVDKQLYNLKYVDLIASHLPMSRIIYCKRNPLDNILSMLRANLVKGNNFTSSVIDSAKFLIEQESLMIKAKNKHQKSIYTFNYDDFVVKPEINARNLMLWLGLEWSQNYLSPESAKREVQTASLLTVRNPINNQSLSGWVKYNELLEPAAELIRKSGLFQEYKLIP